MTSVFSEAALGVSAAASWALLRDVGAAACAFPGVLVASHLEHDVRTVTFAGGTVVRERIIAIDEAQRRIVYAVIEGRFDHHSASMQIVPDGPDGSRFLWFSDFLPNDFESRVRGLVEQGTAAFRRAAEALSAKGADDERA
jgi:hypothetical protein